MGGVSSDLWGLRSGAGGATLEAERQQNSSCFVPLSFLDSRMDYARHYAKLISRAQERNLVRGGVERHHIVPRCLGGGNEPGNLVRLKTEEHCIAHLLLAKMHPENEKLVFAAASMSGRSPHLQMTKNKRYRRARWIEGSIWGRVTRRNAIRARMRRTRFRYDAEDVARLSIMLKPITDFS